MTDLLFDSPGNPLPGNAAADTFTTRDGKRIRYALFGATERPLRGTVILLQGRNECIEKYFETIRDLQKAGLGVATFDWRGQGGSQRLLRNPRRGHVRRFAHYVTDLEQFYQDIVLPDCRLPLFVLAHSTGALIALLAAPVPELMPFLVLRCLDWARPVRDRARAGLATLLADRPDFVTAVLPTALRTANRYRGRFAVT